MARKQRTVQYLPDMSRLLLPLGLLLLLLALGAAATDAARLPSGGTSARIAYVVDGDTVQLTNGARVRLVQIDTPEVYFGLECWGRQASAETKRLLPPGTAVRIRYGRITVWTYSRVVPPPLLGARVPEKTIPLGGGVARFYGTRGGGLVGERTIPGGDTVAVVTPANTDAFTALTVVRAL